MPNLDWEVALFKALRRLWGLLSPQPVKILDPARVSQLSEQLATLTVLAQVVAREPLRVLSGRSEGGVRGRDLLLPPVMELAAEAEENRALYVLRTVHAATLYRLGLARAIPEDPVLRTRRELMAVARAAEVAASDWPGFGPAWLAACALSRSARPPLESLRGRARHLEAIRQEFLEGGRPWEKNALWEGWPQQSGPPSPPVPLWGGLIPALQEGELTGEGQEHRPPSGTELQAPPTEDLRRVLIDPKEQETKVLQHTFEKVETADNFDGAVRDEDGCDELVDHAEALKELDLRELMRGGEAAQSIYKADLRLDVEIPDVGTVRPGETGIRYDEWDGAAKAWKRNWCTVYPSPVPQRDDAWVRAAVLRHRKLIQRLRRQLEAHRAGRMPVFRQLDGEEVDFDAVVDYQATLASGHSGSGRLYSRSERRRRDFATLVLMDVSLSADAWVENRRVLDVARDSVLVLGEVASLLGDTLAVQAFASNTRNCCRVWNLRTPEEDWSSVRGRLGVLEPQGYTRIGPALRHATATLKAIPANKKLLLLISDGKPNDYDRYEGRYGIGDVRMALKEAQQQGIHTHALAVDAVARDYLPSMLGPGAWNVLLSPDRLPESLAGVYGRLTA